MERALARILTVTLNPAIDRVVSGGGRKDFPGGKGVNVSRALRALGISSRTLVAVAGPSGKSLVRQLRREHLSPVVFPLKGRTRTNVTAVRKNGAVVRDCELGPLWAEEDLRRFKRFFARHVRGAEMVVFSGSLPPGVPADFYCQLLSLAREAGAVTVLDTSGAALREGVRGRPFLLKPNRQEAEEFCGQRLSSWRSVKKGLKSFSGHGMKMVLLTLGARGAVLLNGQRCFRAKGPRVSGHAVGCGDAALAGCIAAMVSRRRLAEPLRWSVACGTVAAASIKPGAVERGAVMDMAGRIIVNEVQGPGHVGPAFLSKDARNRV